MSGALIFLLLISITALMLVFITGPLFLLTLYLMGSLVLIYCISRRKSTFICLAALPAVVTICSLFLYNTPENRAAVLCFLTIWAIPVVITCLSRKRFPNPHADAYKAAERIMLYALAAVPFGVIIYIIGTPPQENNTANEQESLNTMFLNITREVATAYFETLDDEKTIQVTNALSPEEMRARAENAYGEYVELRNKWLTQSEYDYREFVEWFTEKSVDIECWVRMGGSRFQGKHRNEVNSQALAFDAHIRRGTLTQADGYFLFFEYYVLHDLRRINGKNREIIHPDASMQQNKVTIPNVSAISVSEDAVVFHYNGPEGEEMHHSIREAAQAYLHATPYILANHDTYLILWDSGKLIKMDILPEYTP